MVLFPLLKSPTKIFTVPVSWSVLLTFFPLAVLRCHVLCWGPWSICSWVIFRVRGKDLASSFVYWKPCFPAPIAEDDVFSSLYIFLRIFVKDYVALVTCFYIWVFYFIPLSCVSIFVTVWVFFCYSSDMKEPEGEYWELKV